MIGRQIKGKGFRGLLNYLHAKEGAERLDSNMFGSRPRELAAEFGLVRRQRPELKRAVFHMPVRPAPGETLTREQWKAVADRILTGMGFSGSPYVVYFHSDTAEAHLHIVASRVAYDGTVVSDRNDYFRAMKLLREIEKDYGLRVVPHEATDRRPAHQAEYQVSAGGTGGSVREALQDAITRAAADAPPLSLFLERLREEDVEVRLQVSSRGRVTGISYGLAGLSFRGSSLGRAFGWGGIQGRLGVRYDPVRDLPAVLAHRQPSRAEELQALLPKGETVTEPTSLSAAAPGRPARVDRTSSAVDRQLRALGSERYDLLLVHARSGETQARNGWTPEQVERALGWLKHRNVEGYEILVRPSKSYRSVLVAEVPETALAERRTGPERPAAVVEVSSGRFEAWFLHREPVNRDEATVVRSLLARRLGAADREGSEYGHLAGFTSPLSVPPGGTERAPFVELRDHGGEVYRRGATVLHQARLYLEDQTLREQTDRELRSIGTLSRTAGDPIAATEAVFRERSSGLSLPPGPTDRSGLAAAVEAVSEAQTRFLEVRSRLAEATPADHLAREEELVAAFRTLRDRERTVEDLTGLRSLPPALAVEELSPYVDLKQRLLEATERLETAADRYAASGRAEDLSARQEAALTVRYLEGEIRGYERVRDFRAVDPETLTETALARNPFELEAAYREATERLERILPGPGAELRGEALQNFRQALLEKADSEIALEQHRVDLARARHVLNLERDGISLQIERFEGLASRPNDEQLARYGELVDRLDRLEHRLAPVEARALAAEVSATERALERVGQRLEQGPTPEDLRTYSALLGDRFALRERAEGFEVPSRRGSVDPAELPAARTALTKDAAQVLADPTREHLADFRATAERYLSAQSQVVGEAARIEYGLARRELRQALRELRPDPAGALSPEVLRRWRQALDRFNEAESRLAGRGPEAPVGLPPADPAKLEPLLLRVRRGDHTPDTLSRLHREITAQLTRTHGQPPPLPGSAPSRRELLSALSVYREARKEFLTDLRALPRRSRAADAPAALESLRSSLARYQAASGDLQRATDLFTAGPHRHLLPMRYFLRHPDFRGAPHRAVAAWAAHAGRRGVPEPRLRSLLSRSAPRPRSVPSRFLGNRFSGLVALATTRWVYRLVRRAVHEQVHSR